ncbi:MAG TPA: hypothetical protein VG826_34245 [Pirellulales bacterium]|nr:hypothetical protein [Pirellulales bacterium]
MQNEARPRTSTARHMRAAETILAAPGKRRCQITATAVAGRTPYPAQHARFEIDCPAAGEDSGKMAILKAAMQALLAQSEPAVEGALGQLYERAWATLYHEDGYRLATLEWDRSKPDACQVRVTGHSLGSRDGTFWPAK